MADRWDDIHTCSYAPAESATPFSDAWRSVCDESQSRTHDEKSRTPPQNDRIFRPFRPFPPIGDYAWRDVPQPLRARHIRHALTHVGTSWPRLLAHDWAVFFATGERGAYESGYGEIRRRLADDLMAYGMVRSCDENADHDTASCDPSSRLTASTLLADIIDGIMIICDETAWQIPAHNTYVRDAPQLPWPDPDRALLDLFACETGQLLAAALHLLGVDLPEPIRRRMMNELTHRIVMPYLHDRFWWMGLVREPTNNWTTWCTQNVLATVFLAPFDETIRRQVTTRACTSLDAFLRDYGEDGCCAEGAGYYHSAGLCLFGAMRILADVCPDTFTPLWRLPKIANIATYIVRMRVGEDRYFNFADCSIHAGMLGAREYMFARAVGDDSMACIAAMEWRNGLKLTESDDRSPDNPMARINVLYALWEAAAAHSMMDADGSAIEAEANTNGTADTDGTTTSNAVDTRHAERETFFPSTGIAVMRGCGFDVAVKAGANGGSHSHNDTGNIIVWKNERPVLIDPGVEAYTRQTFSPQRYELWTMQSSWHNLPDFDGVMQRETPDCRAEHVHVSFGADASRVAADLTHAWPAEAGLWAYTRTVSLAKRVGASQTGMLTVDDKVLGTFETAVMHLMTAVEPMIVDPTAVTTTTERDTTLLVGDARLEIHGATGAIGVEMKTLDRKLAAEWETPHLWRIIIPFRKALRIVIT